MGVELDNFRAAVLWGLDSTLDEDGAQAVHTIAELVGVQGASWNGIATWAEQALPRAEDADPRYRSVIVSAASNNAYFRGEFALARRLAGDALRLGVVPGCPAPAFTFIPAFMYARADDLPSLLTSAVAELDRVGASPWDHAQLRSSAAAIAALVGNLALAQAEAAQAIELGRSGDFPLTIIAASYAYGLAWWQTKPEDALATLEASLRAVHRLDVTGCRALALVAQLRASRGRIPAALDALHEAMTIASTNGDRAASAVVVARGIRVLTSAGAEEEAAVLVGIITSGVLAGLRPLPPHEIADHDALLATLRNDLGPDRYDAAADRGARMTFDEVVAFVLHTHEPARNHSDPEEPLGAPACPHRMRPPRANDVGQDSPSREDRPRLAPSIAADPDQHGVSLDRYTRAGPAQALWGRNQGHDPIRPVRDRRAALFGAVPIGRATPG